MSWGLRSECSESMGPSWSDGVNDKLEAEAVKTRVISTGRHFIFLLVLWILLDWQWRADGAQLINASKLTISKANSSQLNFSRAQHLNASELLISRLQLINASMLNVTLPPGVDLNNQNKTVKNYNVPLPVYVCVPLLTAAISGCLIYGFCFWRLKLVRRRQKVLEKQNMRRRRSSLKPGSSERGKKFGLTRAVGPDGDPLIIPTAKSLGLARKLDDVEQLVLDYRSFDKGDCIPEKQKYEVKEVAYDISINPMFNCIQSGACGYVLGGDGKTATTPPGTKKPQEGPDDDSDSDGSQKKGTYKKLSEPSVLKKASTTPLPRLPRLSTESKSKEDPLRRILANKSIVKEIQNEGKGEESAEESSDESPVASSAESLDTESDSGGTSEEESDDESAKKPDTPKSPTASRLSKITSASDSLTKTSSSPKPLAQEGASSSRPRPSRAPGSPESSAAQRVSKAAVSAENLRSEESGTESGEESSTSTPRTSASKSAAPGYESTGAVSSSKYSDSEYSGENTPKTSPSWKSSKAFDEDSTSASSRPRSLTASPSPRPSSTPRVSKAAHSGDDSQNPDSGNESPRSSSAPRASKAAHSGDDSQNPDSGNESPRSSPAPRASKTTVASSTPRASKAVHSGHDSQNPESGKESPRASPTPRASKATVAGGNAPGTTLTPKDLKTAPSGKDSETASPESGIRKSTKDAVSPRFSSVATTDKDQRKGKKPDWDPNTVPERSSIKRGSSKSQGAGPSEPPSPSASDSARKAPERSPDPGSLKKPSVRSAPVSSSKPASPKSPSVSRAGKEPKS